MYESIRDFLLITIGLFFFTLYGLPMMHEAYSDFVEPDKPSDVKVIETPGVENRDFGIVSGDVIIGMAKQASEGDYTLVLDGIMIDDTVPIDLVDLRGVVGLQYIVVRGSGSGGVTTLIANHL